VQHNLAEWVQEGALPPTGAGWDAMHHARVWQDFLIEYARTLDTSEQKRSTIWVPRTAYLAGSQWVICPDERAHQDSSGMVGDHLLAVQLVSIPSSATHTLAAWRRHPRPGSLARYLGMVACSHHCQSSLTGSAWDVAAELLVGGKPLTPPP